MHRPQRASVTEPRSRPRPRTSTRARLRADGPVERGPSRDALLVRAEVY